MTKDPSFLQRLQHAMAVKKITQADLVKLTGIHKSSISSWLQGKRRPRDNNTKILARAIGCNFTWLNTGVGEMFRYAPPPGDKVNFDFGNAASREQDKKLAQMERALFKMQCPGHLDVLFDFIAENYGENKEGTEKFLAELDRTNAKYKLWCEEKKQRDGDPNYIQEQGNITVNGD